MKSISFLCVLLFYMPFSFASYSGRVYIDSNQSGCFDKKDTPLQGIVITDGQNTTRTDKNGKFTLPGYTKTRFITITTPAGYEISRHYIPVNPSVKSYDFTLTPSERTNQTDHSFLQITDTEIHHRGVANNWVAYLKSYIQSELPAFLIHTGDICYENGLRNHIKVVNSNTMNCPVYYGIGNHDLVKGDYGEQLYESIYGPAWYSFDIGNIHYVMTPMASGDYQPGYTKEEVYNWLKNDLAMMDKNKSLIIFNHNILTTSNDFYFGINDTEQIDLRQYNIKAWIYGHWHINYVRNQNGVYTVCTGTLDKGGIDHSTSAFRVFRIGQDDIRDMSLHYCFIDPQAVIAVPTEGQPVPLTEKGNIPLSVNAYHSGSEVKEVSYRIKEADKNTFSPIQQLERQSDWNWHAEIPAGHSNAGEQMEVEVKAEFSNGEIVISNRIFQYESAIPENIQTNENWTNLLKNTAHTGNSSASLTPPLQLGWVKNLKSNVFMSSPLIVDSKVFIASADDNNALKAGVHALDIKTGNQLWKYPTRNSVKNSIACDQNTIFAQDAAGWLYAIDVASGKLKWEKELNLETSPYLTEGLIAENGIAYAGTGNGLGAYRSSDGKEIWTNKSWEQNEAATTTLTLAGNTLIAGAQWDALYGNNAQTGEFMWKLSKDGLSNRGASATFHHDQLYIISGKSIFIIDPASGTIIRQKEINEFNLDVTSTPLITDHEIIFGTAGNGVLALDKEFLGVKWNTVTGQSLIFTSPYTTVPSATVETSPILSTNGIIYIGASDGYLYGIKSGTGEIIWKTKTGAPFLSTVAISGNTLIAADYSGNVYCFFSK